MLINDVLIYTEFLPAVNPKATIIITHGLAEYGEYYKEVAKQLNEASYSVVLYDFRGHGRSQGKRGDIKRYQQLTEDLHILVTFCKDELNLPVYLIGHSMGGVITHLYALTYHDIAGVIVSASPFYTPNQLSVFKMIGYRLFGSLRFKTNYDDPRLTSIEHDKRVNPYVLKSFTLRLVGETLIRGLRYIKKNLVKYELPVLLLQGKEDLIVPVKQSQLYFDSIASEDKTLKLYPNAKHNVFDEYSTKEMVDDIIFWLDERVAKK